MDKRNELVSKIVAAQLTREFMRAFGWQGGTVHQVADEIIKRGLQDADVYAALHVIAADYWRVARV